MEIKAPDLGVESAEVSEIMVSVGDVIEKDDNILLLESDKASVEVPSSAGGKVTSIAVSVGDTVSEGSLLIELEAGDADNDSQDQDAQEQDSHDSDANTGKTDNEDKQRKQTADQSNQSEDQKAQSNTESENNEAKPQNDDDIKADSKENNKEVSANEDKESKTYALPDLGVDEAAVAEIMVSEGDTVDAEDAVLLIESDKASVEVPAPVSGKVEKILVSAGETVTNGQDYIVISSADNKKQSDKTDAGDNSDDNIDATESNKAETKTSKGSSKQSSKDDTQKQNSTDNKNSEQQNQQASSETGSKHEKLSESEVNDKLTEVYAGPAVRKLARQLGVDIKQVEGSALNDRIVKEDLFGYVKQRMTNSGGANKQAATSLGSESTGLPNLPDMNKTEIWGEVQTQNLSRLQKVSIPQLTYNTYLPQVTQFDLSDITETEALRKQLKTEFKKQDISLTILAFIVKATAYALMQYPKFNSHLSDDHSQLIVRQTVNMGIAVATDDGLIVPVIKDAQTKGIKQIATEVGELATKARDKKLGTKELQGASFTISSQGNLGGTYFTPLVNWPQVGILGVSEATMQPRWQEESQTFVPRLMLPLSLSYDHRVINGADAAVFTRYLAQLLADPRRILL